MKKKNKLLYIGHFRDNSGWSRAATDLALASDYAGIDVSCRSILLDKDVGVHPRIAELEKKPCKNPDVIIQHVLPHFYEKNGNAKHIGYFVGEGSSFYRCGWNYRANLMDEIWCPNRHIKNTLKICKPIHVVHHAHNIAPYSKRYKKLVESPAYKFYTIIDFTSRKNLEGLLEAFHSEFNREDVELIIKISKSGLSKTQLSEEFSRLNNSVCSKLRKWKDSSRYNQITLITDYLTEEGIHSLHTSCDCYISLSHGEAWNYPLADAIFHGNESISSLCEGHKEYVPLSSGILVDGSWQACKNTDTLPFYQTCLDNWFVPDIMLARQAMRQKFNESQKTPGFVSLREKRSSKNKELVHEFSYHSIGNKIEDLL